MAKSNASETPDSGLANFEDEETFDDMASILTPRPARPVEAVPDLDAPEEPAKPARAEPAKAKAKSKPESGGGAKKKPAAKKTTPAPAASEAANKIRSSSVHIPTRVLEQLVGYRDNHGMSNGQVVIAAIEKAHPRLKTLIHPTTAGGGLFAQRATRGVRTTDGPLSSLNVRLFEADYQKLDELVAEFGAYSRGHLVTVCLQDFFETT